MLKYYFFITVLSNMNNLLEVISMLALMSGIFVPIVIFSVGYFDFDIGGDRKEWDKKRDVAKKFFYRCLIVFLLTAIPSVFIPSKSQMIFYISANAVKDFSNDNNLSPKIGKFIKFYLDKEIKESSSTNK